MSDPRPAGEHRSGQARKVSKLRVAFVSITYPEDPSIMAGMPYHMAQALRPRFARLETFSHLGGTGMPGVQPPQPPRSRAGRLAARLRRRFLTFDGSIKHVEKLAPGLAYRRTFRVAARYSTRVMEAMRQGSYDVAFGCIASWPMLLLHSEYPTVFFSDGTPSIVNRMYPVIVSARSSGFRRASVDIESTVYSRLSAAAFGAEAIRRSAVDEHGLDMSRSHVVPMGCNVTPDVPLTSTEGLDAPRRDHLRICLVASDPIRKRTDFAVEVAEELAARGIRVKLVLVGVPTERSKNSSVVEHVGLLKLSNPDDRRKHQEVLTTSHIMILPSTGEGAPISPGESAHFGRPSIVSDVVGLPTVVKHGETGIVMPLLTSTVSDYADAIEGLVDNPQEYRRMSAAALERAHSVLNWDCWADRMVELIEQAAASRPRSARSVH